MTIWANDPTWTETPEAAEQDIGFDPTAPFPIAFLNWILNKLDGAFNVEHNADGTHSDITADSGDFGTLDVGGGYGSTGLSVDAAGNVQTDGNLTVDGEVAWAAAGSSWGRVGRALAAYIPQVASGLSLSSQVCTTAGGTIYFIVNGDNANRTVYIPVDIPPGATITRLLTKGHVNSLAAVQTVTAVLTEDSLENIGSTGGTVTPGEGATIATVAVDNSAGGPAVGDIQTGDSGILSHSVGEKKGHALMVTFSADTSGFNPTGLVSVEVRYTTTAPGTY